MDTIKARLGESSTYVGVALIAQGLNEMFKVNELAVVAQVAPQIGEAVATNNWPNALMIGIGAAMALFNQSKFRK
jgi:hypothetical protein